MTEKVNNLTEQQIEEKDNARFGELKAKTDRTEDETKELDGIKERHGGRAQKRIDKLTWEKRDAQERAELAQKERDELNERVKELEGTRAKPAPIVKEEAIKIGDSSFYTDSSLVSMIQAGKITEQEALQHQQLRQKEEAVVEAVSRIKSEGTKNQEKDIRVEDAKKVLKEYPQFSKTDSSFNPNDPLYKLSQELYAESYAAIPKGLSLAIKRAKQILRMNDATVDRSGDLNIDIGGPGPRRTGKEDETTLSEEEETAAIRMYRDMENPKTGRVYTENEIKVIALDAKKARK